jgi:hypothetical protein
MMMSKKHFLAPVLCCLAVASAIAQGAPELPKTAGDSLAGSRVVLPDAATGKVAILIFGFSKASKGPTSAWAGKIQADFGSRPEFALYQLPVLEDVPRLIRGMVISSMRKGVPDNMRDHFVPILQGETALKKFVNYGEPDDAYLVILSRDGKIVEQSRGAPNDANCSNLRATIESLLNQN